MSLLTIRLLGSPKVSMGKQVLTFRTRKVLALLIYLVGTSRMHSRESLMALLWPNSAAKEANATLRVTLSRLRKSLEPAGRFIISEAGQVGFDFEKQYDLDLAWLTTAVSPNTAPEILTSIFELDQGDFLAGFFVSDAPDFDNWATIQREVYQRQVGTIYDRLTQHQLAHNNYELTVTTATRWLTRAAFSERPYQRLMAAHALAGNRQAAIKTYEQCQNMLQQEFGIKPAKETVILAKQIEDSQFSIDALQSDTVTPTPKSNIRFPKSNMPFVGRGLEHNQLVAAWRKVNDHGAGVVVVMGSAGVGKTRLVNAFQQWAMVDSPGVEIWQGRAFEMGGRLAYQPVIEALQRRLEQENAPEDLLDDVWLAELSQLMPELRARYPDLPLPLTGEPSFVYARLFAAVALLGTQLATQQPSIFVLDDMQWADEDTLAMVHYLAQNWAENNVPIMLLVTLRQENLDNNASLREWLLRLDRASFLIRLQLNLLNAQAVRELVLHLSNPDIAEDIAYGFADWLWSETQGLPFFIEAVLQMLLEQKVVVVTQSNGRIVYDFTGALIQINSATKIPIPPSVREAILVRLEQVSATAAALSLAAAVLGRECSFDRLCQVADVDELDALQAIEVLVNGRLLVENENAQRPYILAHDYIREVVYSKNREARRRIYHRRALIALEADHAPAIECAFHALASRLDEPAFRFSMAAGDEALQSCAFHESLDHYERAWKAAWRISSTTATSSSNSVQLISPQARLQLYQKRGRAYELANDYQAAQTNYAEMLELAIEQQDQVMELAALNAQCIIYATPYSSLFNTTKARGLGFAALNLSQKLNTPEAEVLALRGLTSVEMNAGGDIEKALAYGEKALTLARELDLKEQIGYMLGNLTLMYFGREQFAVARAAIYEAQGIWSTLRNLPMLADVYSLKVGLHLYTGEYKALLKWAPDALKLSQSIGNLMHQKIALLEMAEVHAIQGQFGLSVANIETMMTLTKGNENAMDYFDIYGWVRVFSLFGIWSQAEPWADKLHALFVETHPRLQIFSLIEIARVEIGLQKLSKCKAILAQAFELFEREELVSYARAPLFVTDAHLQLAQGYHNRALARLDALIPHLHEVGSRYYLPEALWLQGVALFASQKPVQAKESLLAARAAAEENEEQVVMGRILYSLADLEKTLGNEKVAQKLLIEAQDIIAHINKHTGTAELQINLHHR